MAFELALLAVEAELERQSAELSSPIQEVCRYATKGGRRTRAALLLGAAQQCGRRAVLAAVALEMLHAATLLQDDIFDSGEVRRGRAAAHVKYGKAIATLASDWLLVRSLELAAEVHPCFFRSLAQAGRSMAEAEAWELAAPALHSLVQAKTIDCQIARGKTAVLFASALYGAATLCDLSAAHRQRWEQAGIEMGVTYQLVDDCVDVYSTEEAARKCVGRDLLAGRFTLPALLALSELESLGIAVAKRALQHRAPGRSVLTHMQRSLYSLEVKERLRAHVQDRFEAHRREIRTSGIPPSALDDWSADLWGKLGACSLYREGICEAACDKKLPDQGARSQPA